MMDLCISQVFTRKMPEVVNVQDYRCVPLDLLKNVDKDGNVEINVTPEKTSLKDITEQTKSDVFASGSIASQTFSAKTTEGLIIFAGVIGSILGAIVLFFLGKNAWKLIRLDRQTYIVGLIVGLSAGSILTGIVVSSLFAAGVFS